MLNITELSKGSGNNCHTVTFGDENDLNNILNLNPDDMIGQEIDAEGVCLLGDKNEDNYEMRSRKYCHSHNVNIQEVKDEETQPFFSDIKTIKVPTKIQKKYDASRVYLKNSDRKQGNEHRINVMVDRYLDAIDKNKRYQNLDNFNTEKILVDNLEIEDLCLTFEEKYEFKLEKVH